MAVCVVCSCAGAQTVYFSKGFTTNLYSSMYTGSSWPAGTLVKTMPNEGLWVQGANCPTRDEVALAQTDYDSRISILFKTSGSWGTPITLTSSSSFTTMRKFSVVYERLSGDCLVAYSTGATKTCATRTGASGSLGSATTAQSFSTYIDLVRLYAKPASDEVLLLTADGSFDLRASVWDGSSWGTASAITTSLPDSKYEPFDAMYQSSSGTAMIVYSEASVGTPKYRTRLPGGWTGATNMGAIPSAARWIKLAAHPTSNNAVAVMIDAGNRVHAFTWNGTAWTGPTTVTTNCGYADRRPAAVAWQANGSLAMLVYSDNSTTPKYQTWNGTSWSAAASLSNMGDKAQYIQVVPASSGSDLYILAADLASNLHAWKWDGTSMTSMATVESLLGGDNATEQFHMPTGWSASTPVVRVTAWKELTSDE